MKRNNILTWLFIVMFTMVGLNSMAQVQENIQINKFDIVLKNDRIYINWSTDSASATNYFEIEKSNDGKNFKTFAYILGEDPSLEGKQFGYFDAVSNRKGKSWYRLKHVAEDGALQYSNSKMILL